MGTLIVIGVAAAVFVLFADEVSGLIKKLYGKFWIRFLMPLVFASWLWIWYDEFMPLFLEWLQTNVLSFDAHVASLVPELLRPVIFVLGVFILASTPAWIVYWYKRRKGELEAGQFIATRVYLFTWVFIAILML